MAIIVDDNGYIIGTGYNGSPRGMEHCSDGACPRASQDGKHGAPYDDCIAIHAEANALLHSDYSLRKNGCTLYVNGMPCLWCTKLIVNSGVKRLVYLEPDVEYDNTDQILTFLIKSGLSVNKVLRSELDER
jgi:dCMP deaminase